MALGALAAGGLILMAMALHSRLPRAKGLVHAARITVPELGLTDLALFTEARYTRHPSQADLHTPFQDHPLSFDHFPSGSLLSPPRWRGQSNRHGQSNRRGQSRMSNNVLEIVEGMSGSGGGY